MICPVCGTLNEDTAKFCGGCGARLITEEPQMPVAEAAAVEETVFVEEVTAVEEVTLSEEILEEQIPAQDEIPGQPVEQLPVQPKPVKDAGKGLGIAGMVLGILSLMCCGCAGIALFMSVVSVILSCVGIVKSRRCGYVNGFAIAGLACGGVGVLANIISLVFTVFMSASFSTAMEAQPNMYY